MWICLNYGINYCNLNHWLRLTSTFRSWLEKTVYASPASRRSTYQPYPPTAATCKHAAARISLCCKLPSPHFAHARGISLPSLMDTQLHAIKCWRFVACHGRQNAPATSPATEQLLLSW